jgi:hypothetical protein
MLEFINPAFVWLSLAGVIPLIIHLLNRRRYKIIHWAAMDFLLKALRKNRRRLQMETLILLLLRILIVILLAFILAKPSLKGGLFLTEPDTHFVVAIDNSYSMSYQLDGFSTLFDEAKRITRGLIESLKTKDKLSLITLSAKPEIIISEVSMQKEEAKRKLANLSISDYATDVARTLFLADEILSKSTASRKAIYLITDNQKTAWDKVEASKGKLQTDAIIKIIQVGPPDISNNSISRIYTDSPIITTKKPVTFYTEIRRYATRSLDKITIKVNFLVNGERISSSVAELVANGAVLAPFVHTFNEPGEYWIKIEIENDNLSIDDSRLYSVVVKEGIPILIFNGEPDLEPSEDEVLFLRYALVPELPEPTANIKVSPYLIDITTSNNEFTNHLSDDKYNLVILANVEFISQEILKSLENFVREGGGLLIFLGDKIDRTNYNQLLYKDGLGILPYPLGEIKGDKTHNQVVRFGEIDFSHPALLFFSSVKERFYPLAIYQYYELREQVDSENQDTKSPLVRVLARFNTANNPALIAEKSYGEGKIILIATTADTEWNILPARAMYLMLIDQIAMYLSTFREKINRRNLIVGEPIEIDLKSYLPGGSEQMDLRLPRKGTVSLQSRTRINKQSSASDETSERRFVSYENTDEVGLYTVSSKDKRLYFAVNPEPKEGNLRQITKEEIQQFIPAVQYDTITKDDVILGSELLKTERIDKMDKFSISHFWRYLLYILLVSLVLEMIFAWRFGRL